MVPVTMTISGKRVFADEVMGVLSNPMTGILIRRGTSGHSHPQKEEGGGCEEGGREWSMLPQSKDRPGLLVKQGEARKHSSLQIREGAQPADTLTSDFSPPEL